MARQRKSTQPALRSHRWNEGRCWREEAEPIYGQGGQQIGWRCLGCGQPFEMRSGRVKQRYRVAIVPTQGATI